MEYEDKPLLTFKSEKQEKHFVMFAIQATLFSFLVITSYQFENKILFVIPMVLLLYLSFQTLKKYRKGD